MDKNSFETIRAWAKARKIASENSGMMLRDSSQAVMEECARRMKVLNQCEDDMLMIERSKMPSPLINYVDARVDSGCPRCWLSSAGPTHEDCKRKIERFFRLEEELAVFGLFGEVDGPTAN